MRYSPIAPEPFMRVTPFSPLEEGLPKTIAGGLPACGGLVHYFTNIRASVFIAQRRRGEARLALIKPSTAAPSYPNRQVAVQNRRTPSPILTRKVCCAKG